ncbi:hypothetical protein N9V90_02595 [Endozoicomonas sp.]|nr:hypothetical protein [Endozoicomonas sp.]
MEVAFLPILNKVFQFCIEHPKVVQSAANVLPKVGGFIKEMFSGSQPADKNMGARKVEKTSVPNQPRESVRKWIKQFSSQKLSQSTRAKYKDLKTGSILAYSGAFGIELTH